MVAIGKDTLVDVEMKVGGMTEAVTVTGETSSVSIGSTTAGGVVTTKQIAELPLNGRSFLQLATLAGRASSPAAAPARTSPAATAARSSRWAARGLSRPAS